MPNKRRKRNFSGSTFVCFIDISGFKAQMKNDLEDAGRMLNVFYSAGYRALLSRKSLNSVFVSDCGIIYSLEGNSEERLITILETVKEINLTMLERDYLTTTSIAYGDFEYKSKIAFDGISKNAFLGNGYLNAYSDTVGDNKPHPGEVRLVKIFQTPDSSRDITSVISLDRLDFKFLRDRDKHFYYHWHSSDVADFEKVDEFYQDYIANTFGCLKYDQLKQNLKSL